MPFWLISSTICIKSQQVTNKSHLCLRLPLKTSTFASDFGQQTIPESDVLCLLKNYVPKWLRKKGRLI